MSAPFTAGPWHWTGETLMAGPNGTHLLYTKEAPGLGNAAEANARLIAAAPDLLEVVGELAQRNTLYAKPHDRPLIIAARDALRRALGTPASEGEE